MPQNVDLAKLAKKVIDGVTFGFNKHAVLVSFKVGEQQETFAMSPEDSKMVQAGLGKTIELFEVQFGKIPDPNQPIPTPFDVSKG